MLSDTPPKLKPCQSAPSHIDLEKKRQNTIDELKEHVPEIEMDEFLKLLPQLHRDINLTDILAQLSSDSIISPTGFWKGFHKPPSSCHGSEEVVFSNFPRIINAIVSKVKRQPTIHFHCSPWTTPTSSTRDNGSKPDCYGMRLDSTASDVASQKPKWINIFVPGEFKKYGNLSSVNDVSIAVDRL
jgi:hypothetical protein